MTASLYKIGLCLLLCNQLLAGFYYFFNWNCRSHGLFLYPRVNVLKSTSVYLFDSAIHVMRFIIFSTCNVHFVRKLSAKCSPLNVFSSVKQIVLLINYVY